MSAFHKSRLYKQAKLFIAVGLDTVLPPRCAVTGDIVERQGVLSARAWRGLDFVADPKCARCGVPFDFDMSEEGDNGQCMACLQNPPVYKTCRAALIYNDASRDLILGFKHGDKTHLVQSFVPWLTRCLHDSMGRDINRDSTVIVSVPLHRLRLLRRRYNQSALIADILSQHLGIKHDPMILQRVRATQTQGHLNTKERADNVCQAFAVSEKHTSYIVGKDVILVDDVYTTGATVRECTQTLLACGVRDVHVVALARVGQR